MKIINNDYLQGIFSLMVRKTVFFVLFIILFLSCSNGGGADNTDDSFTIGYNANGAESGTAPSAQNGNSSSPQAVQANIGSLAKNGYLFDGWNTKADGSGADYTPGTSYNGDNITLYAKWARIFNYNVNSVSPAPSLDGQQRAPAVSYASITGLTSLGATLSEIYIPESIDGYPISSIGAFAFQGYNTISNISIPSTVTSIGNSAFADCNRLTDLTIPSSVSSIGSGAFSGCEGLTNMVLQSSTPPAIGTGAFTGCTVLTITVPTVAVGLYTSAAVWNSVTIVSPGTFSITYNGNGSDGGVVPLQQVGMTGLNIQISGNNGTLTRAGCDFVGWNTRSDGKGNNYNQGDSYSGPLSIVLYAQWSHPDYIVTFDGQGANTQASPKTINVVSPANTISSLPTDPTRNGYGFGGWYTEPDGAGESFVIGSSVLSNLTVYAKWNANSYTITYNGNGNTSGSAPASQNGKYSSYITLKTNTGNLKKRWCIFDGWNTKEDGSGINFSAGDTYILTSNMTLYAKWKSVFSSTVSERDSVAVGDIVLSNKATITPSSYTIYASELSSAGLIPVGVVAYKGLTGTAGKTGHWYMMGLNQGTSLQWAKKDSTGYNKVFNTSETDGEESWAIIMAADAAGTATAELQATNYPAFYYAQTYNTLGYIRGWFLPSIGELRTIIYGKYYEYDGVYGNSGVLKLNISLSAIINAGGVATQLQMPPADNNDRGLWSSSKDDYVFPADKNRASGIDVTNGCLVSAPKSNIIHVRVVHTLD